MTKTISSVSGVVTIAALALFALAPIAYAAVSSDKDDYTPGETVTISGDGYSAGESVFIDVTAPYGSELGVAVASGSGEFSWSFVLPNDESAIGEYTYTATGLDSGIIQSGSFTDAINITFHANSTCTGADQASLALHANVCVKATGLGMLTGHLEILDPSNVLFTTSTSGTGNREAPFVPNACGTWTAKVIKDSDSSVQATDTVEVVGCATLTLEKSVTKDNGGTAADTDWTLSATGATTTITGVEGDASITNATVDVGSYDLSESGGPSGYSPSAWVCVGGNQLDDDTVALGEDDDVICTITNDDIPASLTLVKVVVNDNGGTATTTEWTLVATGPTGFGGFGPIVTNSDIDAGTYDLSENGPPGYSASDWVCEGGNQTDGDTVEIGLGEKVRCTITNDDSRRPPSPPPLPCGCTLQTDVFVSDGTTKIGGANAVPVATSSAWTASIPGATWIWQASSTVPNAVVAFEKTFTVSGTVLSAQLDIAADNSYKVFIDGVQVAADASAVNFTLATQDTYDLTANVTPGVHTLRIEVTNNGVFSSLNPGGLLYKFVIKTCPPPIGGILVTICNNGTIINLTTARSSTGGNVAGGSAGGDGGRGGDIDPTGNFNNGGASAGNGGSGGNAGPGGLITTGNASANASTTNDGNSSDVGIDGSGDLDSSSLSVIIDNTGGGCKCPNVVTNDTRARARTGSNTAGESAGGNGNDGGDVVAGSGDNNNGGASGGSGGAGGTGGTGGIVQTGTASSIASTNNKLNTTRIRVSW